MYERECTKSPLTASCVWRDPKNGEIVVGRKAFQRKGKAPEPVCSIKREMGLQSTVDLSGEEKTPPEISAYILKELVGQVTGVIEKWNTDDSRWKVERSIVTIPAYFKQPAVEATREAASIAGMELLELLHEPTAAATYYCWQNDLPDGLFMVYDLGGGTFDVSILKRTAGEFDVLGIAGDNFLGGDDFDQLLAGHMIEVLSEDYALDLDVDGNPDDGLIFAQLCMLAEGVKKQLSSQGEVLVRDSMIPDQDGSRMIIDMVIERATFAELIRGHIEKTIQVCHQAIDRAHERGGVSISEIDQILLVGGSTYVPLVRQMVTEQLCADPQADEERAKCEEPIQDGPDTCVAAGAALRATTHGLDVYDDERTGRVHFRDQASTSSEETTITGDVTLFDEDREAVDLEGGCIELVAGDYTHTDSLSEQASFRFRDVPLESGGPTQLNFAVYDADDNRVLSVGREVTQSEKSRIIGDASNPSVLAEPILLEVRSGGQVSKATLIETGESLAADARHQFAHPGGNVAKLRLTLYHGPIKIKDVLIPVDPATPQGTPITMDVHMDQEYLITVDGAIGNQQFSAQVEPPPPPEPPTEEDIARWREAFSDSREFMGAVDQVQAEAEFDQLIADMQQAISSGDRARAVARKQEMEARMTEWQRAPAVMDPPWEKFEGLRRQTLSLISEVEDEGAARFKPDETRDRVDALTQLARNAYDANNQSQYGQAWEDLLELARYVQGLLKKKAQAPQNPAQQAAAFASMLKGELQEVRDLAQAMKITEHDDDLDRIGEELSGMPARAVNDPETVMTDCRRVAQELDAIRRQLRAAAGGGNQHIGIPEKPGDARTEET